MRTRQFSCDQLQPTDLFVCSMGNTELPTPHPTCACVHEYTCHVVELRATHLAYIASTSNITNLSSRSDGSDWVSSGTSETERAACISSGNSVNSQ